MRVYSSKEVNVIAVTIPITTGRADQFVQVTPVGPAYDDEISEDGEVTRFETNETRIDVKIMLKRSSPHHAELAAIHAADRSSTGGAGIGGFLLKDLSGATLYACDRAWIKGLPDWTMGKAVGDITWELRGILKPIAGLPGGN